jgi:hypothetical protein
MNNKDEIMKCLEDCIEINNELYNMLYKDEKLKDKIKLLENDESEYYFNIELKTKEMEYKYGIRVANQNNNPKLMDIILFRWENKLDISTYFDIYIKDINKDNKCNTENIIEEIIKISEYFKDNIVDNELVVNIYNNEYE